jgi:hypothetical protein
MPSGLYVTLSQDKLVPASTNIPLSAHPITIDMDIPKLTLNVKQLQFKLLR